MARESYPDGSEGFVISESLKIRLGYGGGAMMNDRPTSARTSYQETSKAKTQLHDRNI